MHKSLTSNSITTQMQSLCLMDTVTQNLVQNMQRDNEDRAHSTALILFLTATPKFVLVKKNFYHMSKQIKIYHPIVQKTR